MKRKWTPYADLVITNAKIYTVDLTIQEIQNGIYDFTIIQNGFVAVKDGKIIGVGEGLDKSFIGEETVVNDVKGKTVIPGLMDSHMHAMFAAMDLANVPLKDCTSLDQMVSLLKERAASVASDKWIK